MSRSACRPGRKARPVGASILLLACLSGCRHKPLPPPPPAASAPPVTSSTVTVITPLPSLPLGKAPDVKPAPAPTPAPPPVQEPVHRFKRKSRKATTVKPETQMAESQTAQAPAPAPAPGATGTPEQPAMAPGVSQSIGQLSAGTAISSRDRARMLAEIGAQEARLSKLRAAANADLAATQQSIKTFLSKARQAVAQNDLDGAETLNTKARVLLNELQEE
jgi:hypothetical protein